MNIHECFPSKYLVCADLGGQDRNVAISRLAMEEVDKEKQEQAPIVYFDGITKGLRLNKTNGNTIAELHGGETDGWAGKTITLFPTQVDYQGTQKACIRVRIGTPNGSQAGQPTATGGGVGFS